MTCEDVEWGKLLCEDLLRKQRVLYIERHNLTTGKKLDLVSAHIQLSAGIDSVSTGKDTSTPESSASSSEANCVLQEVGSDTTDDENIPLAKVASNSWSDSDNDVTLSIFR